MFNKLVAIKKAETLKISLHDLIKRFNLHNPFAEKLAKVLPLKHTFENLHDGPPLGVIAIIHL